MNGPTCAPCCTAHQTDDEISYCSQRTTPADSAVTVEVQQWKPAPPIVYVADFPREGEMTPAQAATLAAALAAAAGVVPTSTTCEPWCTHHQEATEFGDPASCSTQLQVAVTQQPHLDGADILVVIPMVSADADRRVDVCSTDADDCWGDALGPLSADDCRRFAEALLAAAEQIEEPA